MELVLNGNKIVPINSYNRDTVFASDGSIASNAYVNFTPTATTMNTLHEFASGGITQLYIRPDAQSAPVYRLDNIDAHLVSMNENIYDGGMNCTLSMSFNLNGSQPSN